jgi:hypothetical protein
VIATNSATKKEKTTRAIPESNKMMKKSNKIEQTN